MSLFGSSGIRGVIGQEITPALALKIGAAVGSAGGPVIIGKDSRTSGDMMVQALAAGVMSAGADISYAGMTSTPTLARSASRFQCGIMVTASHNPPEYNGVKVWNPDGSSFDSEQMEEVERFILSEAPRSPDWRGVGRRYTHEGVVRDHMDAVIASIGSVDVDLVVDCGCGATCNISPQLLRELGCGVLSLNAQADGHFPGRTSEPTEDQLTELKRTVVSKGAGLGIAHDGDGDRMVAVDEKGNFIDGDKLLALFASLIGAKGIVAPIDASMVLDDIVKGKVIRTRVGDVYVAEALKRSGFGFGGEPSGTFIFPTETYCPDGVYAGALLAKYAAGERLSDLLASLPSYPRSKESFKFPSARSAEVRQRLKEELESMECDRLITVDGYRAEFSNGWFLVRLSGTEPKVRISAEARDDGDLNPLMERARNVVRRCLK